MKYLKYIIYIILLLIIIFLSYNLNTIKNKSTIIDSKGQVVDKYYTEDGYYLKIKYENGDVLYKKVNKNLFYKNTKGDLINE